MKITDNETRQLLFQVAAFLKIVFKDRLVSGPHAEQEAAKLLDKIGKILTDTNGED
jgi:hypothetical protein